MSTQWPVKLYVRFLRFYVFLSKSKKHDFLRFLSCCTRFLEHCLMHCGLGLEKNFRPRFCPRPHSVWPRPWPWPRAKLASLTSVPITQSPVRYIHTTLLHSSFVLGLHCAVRFPHLSKNCPFLLGNPTSIVKKTHRLT